MVLGVACRARQDEPRSPYSPRRRLARVDCKLEGSRRTFHTTGRTLACIRSAADERGRDVTTQNTTKDRLDKNAPDPEAPGKPDSPDDIEKRSWKYVFVKTVREFSSDQCTDIAAALTYYAVLSIFPGAVAIFSLLGVFGQGRAASDALLEIVGQVAPERHRRGDPRSDRADGRARPPPASPLVIGILLAIWSASGYVGAFSRAMNRIYEIEEGRPFWKLKPVQLLVTVIALVAGRRSWRSSSSCPGRSPTRSAMRSASGRSPRPSGRSSSGPCSRSSSSLIVAILYYATPNAKQPKFRWMSLGALLAIVVLAIATVAFGFYVAQLLQLQPDLRLARRRDHLPALAVDREPRAAVRCRVRRRAGARASAAGRNRRGGGHPASPARHPQERQGSEKEEKDIAEGRRIREQHASDDEANEAAQSGGR